MQPSLCATTYMCACLCCVSSWAVHACQCD